MNWSYTHGLLLAHFTGTMVETDEGPRIRRQDRGTPGGVGLPPGRNPSGHEK